LTDIAGILVRANELYPGETSIIDGARSFTYAKTASRVARLARFIEEALDEDGARIAIICDNRTEFLELSFAAAAARKVLVPINTRLSEREIAQILEDSGAQLVFATDETAPRIKSTPTVRIAPPTRSVEPPSQNLSEGSGALFEGRNCMSDPCFAAPRGMPPNRSVERPESSFDYERIVEGDPIPLSSPAVPGDTLAHLYYTSGTTGRPKGVMLTHRNVTVHALAAIAELSLTDTDTWGHYAPLFHLADAWAVFAVTWVGGRHVMQGRFTAKETLDSIERHRVTITNLIPTMLGEMLAHEGLARRDLSSLRSILSGGAPIAPAMVQRVVEALETTYIQTYGMTETSPYLTFSTLKKNLAGRPRGERLEYAAKTGRPCLAVQLKVVDERGVPVPADGETVGEIRVRGETVTPGYWRRPEETAAAFEDGWLKTGDLATVDSEGYVDIVDRIKDVIISGGENIYSTEVENALYEHPAVLEVAVFGVPHERWGEAVRAAVVLREGHRADAEGLIDFCKQRLARYKAPKSVVFLERLPRTGSGKIAKRLLRAPTPPGEDT
jgi:fatty-acyl-CoA synthase